MASQILALGVTPPRPGVSPSPLEVPGVSPPLPGVSEALERPGVSSHFPAEGVYVKIFMALTFQHQKRIQHNNRRKCSANQKQSKTQ